MKSDTKSEAGILRQKAEELLKNKLSKTGSQLSEIEISELIHELEAHQIELGLQNQELLLAKSIAQDVTQKDTELYDFAPSGYFTLSKQGEIIQLNHRGAIMLGKERSLLINRPFVFFVTRDTKPTFNLFFDNIFIGKANEFCEVALTNKGDLPLFVHITGIANENGEQCQINVFDITRQKQGEQALQNERLTLRTLIDNIPYSIYTKDLAGRKTLANLTEIRFMGAESEAEVIGKTDFEFYPKELAEEFLADDQSVMQKGNAVINREEYLPGENNQKRWLLTSKLPMYGEKGHIIGMLGIGRDITERKLAEENLEKERLRLFNVLEALPIMVCLLKPDYHVAFANRAFRDMFGESHGRRCYEYCFGKKEPCVFCESYSVLKTEKPHHWQVTIPDGARIVDVYDFPFIDVDGSPMILEMEIDITEQKRANLKLEEQNKELVFQNEEKEKRAAELIIAKVHAEESDRLKSAFLANMSHEIRTPMNGILGFAELLKEPDLTGEEQQDYIRVIEKSGARMLNIINDIVNISKIQSGMMQVNIQESNINEQIEYIYSFFKPEVEGKGMQLSFKNALPAKEAIIKTDREKIIAILTNLVKNSIKYSEKGSIEFGYNKEGEYLEFFVKDTGIGIAKDRQVAIFDRFVQADITDKQALQGAGLGLTITKSYVEMLGGKIWVESEFGKGSIFYFTIPCNAEPEKEVAVKTVVSEKKETNPIRNLKILVAEDDEVSDMFIQAVIKMFGREILTARTGIEALEICRNNPDIDLVLMDIKMPEMDGYEAIRKIRLLNKEVVIISQTAYALVGEREKAIEAGCNDYIAKPIKKSDLEALIQKYFNK